MHKNSYAVRVKSFGTNLAVPPVGDFPQVQICDKCKQWVIGREEKDFEGKNNDWVKANESQYKPRKVW